MSEPSKDYRDPIRGAISEIISALSALHMPPEPITEETKEVDGGIGENGYLTDVDYWARHAQQHMRTAIELLHQANTKQESCANCENHATDAERYLQAVLFFKGRFEHAEVNEMAAKMYAKTLEFMIEDGLGWVEAFDKLDALMEGEEETEEL